MTRPATPTPPSDDLDVPTDDAASRVVARPDGFYWLADDGQQQFGPFATAADALAALREGIDTGLEPDESRSEAEAEVGYVDPNAGEEGAGDQ